MEVIVINRCITYCFVLKCVTDMQRVMIFVDVISAIPREEGLDTISLS